MEVCLFYFWICSASIWAISRYSSFSFLWCCVGLFGFFLWSAFYVSYLTPVWSILRTCDISNKSPYIRLWFPAVFLLNSLSFVPYSFYLKLFVQDSPNTFLRIKQSRETLNQLRPRHSSVYLSRVLFVQNLPHSSIPQYNFVPCTKLPVPKLLIMVQHNFEFPILLKLLFALMSFLWTNSIIRNYGFFILCPHRSHIFFLHQFQRPDFCRVSKTHNQTNSA